MLKVIILYAVIVLAVAGLFYWYGRNQNQPPANAINATGENQSSGVSVKVNANGKDQIIQVQNQAKHASAIIKTARGDIELALYPDAAPKTVANFVKKANAGFYKNLKFHRVEDWVIQGGDPLGNGTGGGSMPTELNDKPFVAGSLGVARGQDINISNDAQFFITKSDASWLNGQYTNFGIVTKGMDVVQKIQRGDVIQSIIIK